MGKKKFQIKLYFEDIALKFDVSANERPDLIKILNEETPVIRHWTEQEEFFGKRGEISYVDGISLSLTRIDAYKFNKTRLENSSYYYNYSHFDKNSQLRFKELEGGYSVSGELILNVRVDTNDLQDYTQPGLLHFEFLTFAVKGSGEHINIQKYGADWELERSECNNYRKGLASGFLENLPRIDLPQF